MNTRELLISALLSWTLISYFALSEACDIGWFGSRCQYKCRCSHDKCGEGGICTHGAPCQVGWFGPACQYVDLAYQRSEVPGLTDGDDETCGVFSSQNSVTITLDNSYPFSWLRVHATKTALELQHSLRVVFGKRSSVGCTNQRSTIVDNATLDIHCDLNEAVKVVTLIGDGVQYLCSVYVSGGRNVALKQSTTQSSTYKEKTKATGNQLIRYTSDKAVDGNTNPNFYQQHTCSHTDAHTPSGSWSVMFPRPQRVNRYVVYNRNSSYVGERLVGFTLESFDVSGSRVFYHKDREEIAKLVYTLMSPAAGPAVSRVEIKEDHRENMVTLCEVEVYGDSVCRSGQFGRECEYSCNCAADEACFTSTGGCPSGCADGYYGEACDKVCPGNKYGGECSHTCSQFCVPPSKVTLPSCYHINGACHYGCSPGYEHLNCTEACRPGTYGQDCKFTCSEFCLTNSSSDRPCDHVDGGCLRGCVSGYHGQNCSSPCQPGYWGPECTHTCSEFCLKSGNSERSCDHVSGKCLHGCVVGYEGDDCMMACQPGKHGPDCSTQCSEFCIKEASDERSCDHTNGTCLRGCMSGYEDHNCLSICQPGYYGAECTQACSDQCLSSVRNERSCDHTNGTCLQGCVSGYEGDNCTTECKPGTYGPFCKSACSEFCINDTGDERSCDHINGTCLRGCMSGYEGPTCLSACRTGYYGQDCGQQCSQFCLRNEDNERSCDHVNGTCLRGCVSGYEGGTCMKVCEPGTYGPDCESACSEFCVKVTGDGRSCDSTNGTCLHGCMNGYQGHDCMEQGPISSAVSTIQDTSNIGVIIGVILAVIVVGVLPVLIYCKYKARKQAASDKDGSTNSVDENGLPQYMQFTNSGTGHEASAETENSLRTDLITFDMDYLEQQPA